MREPADAKPLVIQSIEPGEPPASMVVVTSEPKFYIDPPRLPSELFANALRPTHATHRVSLSGELGTAGSL
jgi:hypothetical protein